MGARSVIGRPKGQAALATRRIGRRSASAARADFEGWRALSPRMAPKGRRADVLSDGPGECRIGWSKPVHRVECLGCRPDGVERQHDASAEAPLIISDTWRTPTLP